MAGVLPRRHRPSSHAIACSQCRVPVRVVLNGELRKPRILILNAMPSSDGLWKLDPSRLVAHHVAPEDYNNPEVDRYAAHSGECAGPLPTVREPRDGGPDASTGVRTPSGPPTGWLPAVPGRRVQLPDGATWETVVDTPPVWVSTGAGERVACAFDATHHIGVLRHTDGQVDAYCAQCTFAPPLVLIPKEDQADGA